MRQYKWFYLLLIAILILPSCQTSTAAIANADAQSSLVSKVNPLIVSILARQTGISSEPEANECLNCHADKQRLIESAKEEVVVEAESSGVG